jgi:hypothetical protein
MPDPEFLSQLEHGHDVSDSYGNTQAPSPHTNWTESSAITPIPEVEGTETNLRFILVSDPTIDNSWSTLRHSTERVVEYRQEESLDANYLQREYKRQHFALTAFLEGMENYSSASETHIVPRIVSNLWATDGEKSFWEACKDLRLLVVPNMTPEARHNLCRRFVAAYNTNSCTKFFRLFLELQFDDEGIFSPIANHYSGNDRKFPERRDELISRFDDAFAHPYRSHALDSFISYLDILWLNMQDGFDQVKGSKQSFCTAIVQSSCTGKSRLVERFELLQRIINLLT